MQSIQYLKAGTTTDILPEHAYSYDARGNIAKVEVDGRDAIEYTYDAQNQLIKETEGNLVNTYTYDTYGNIRSISKNYRGLSLISTDRRAGTLHGSMEDSSHQPRMEQIPSQTPMMWTASARSRPSTVWNINT